MKTFLNDFRYMWRGHALRTLTSKDANLLAPIDSRSDKQGSVLLLLHGFSSSPAVFRELLPKLTMYDAIICPVLPGHAHSIVNFAHTKAEEWLATTELLCETLCKTYKQVDVLGLSLGGLLTCYLAKRYTFHHIYLLAPAIALHLNIPLAKAAARTLHTLGFRYLRNNAGNLHTNAHQELTYRQVPLTIILELFKLIQDAPDLPTNCPVDLFLGRFDAVVDSPTVAKKFENLSNTKIHWLEHSAHVLTLDGDINVIIEVIQNRWKVQT